MSRHDAILILAAGLAVAAPAGSQQVADTAFDVTVARPAYRGRGPRVLVDEAHRNFHTIAGRYGPFARLLRNDGYQVAPNTRPFTREGLRGAEVLVIANALGAAHDGDSEASGPAFTEAECGELLEWVRAGGALLLVADHAPFGAAAEGLGRRFGVGMSKGFTLDVPHAAPAGPSPTVILYSRDQGNLADHPLTRGRDSTERVSRVIAFTGQSLLGPAGSRPLMLLGDRAWDVPHRAEIEAAASRQPGSPSAVGASAAGRAQGLTLRVGQGRVAVLGEAAMLSAQVAGPTGSFKMGMNAPGTDNKQFALNLMHWLSGLLPG